MKVFRICYVIVIVLNMINMFMSFVSKNLYGILLAGFNALIISVLWMGCEIKDSLHSLEELNNKS